MAPVTMNPITTAAVSDGLQAWALLHQTTVAVICWNLTADHRSNPADANVHPPSVDETRKSLTAATRSDVEAFFSSAGNVSGGGQLPTPPFGTNWRPRSSKNWPPGGGAYPPGSSELEARDKHALLYIVVVLLFYSTGIIVAIVMYLKREKAEIEEEKAYEDYASFRSDPDRWARYFRVQRMIAQLDRVEREAAEKRLLQHQEQSRPSLVGSTSPSGPANPGFCMAVGSDGKSQPHHAPSAAATVSSKRADSGRSRRHRANSPPQQPGVGCCVMVVETETGSEKNRQPFSASSVTSNPHPTTVQPVGTSSGGSATGLIAARSTAVIRRLAPSPSAHARLDRSCGGGSATMRTKTDSSWISTADGRVRPARFHSFAGRQSSKASLSSTVVPPEEVMMLLPPTHIEVHRTVSWSPDSSIELAIGTPTNVEPQRCVSTKYSSEHFDEDVDTSPL